jgi:hypothetical protein
MAAEELLKHPEFDHTVWDLKPAKEGNLTVAKDRSGPINIAYEVHGHGDRHLVVSNLCSIFGTPQVATLHLQIGHTMQQHLSSVF